MFLLERSCGLLCRKFQSRSFPLYLHFFTKYCLKPPKSRSINALCQNLRRAIVVLSGLANNSAQTPVYLPILARTRNNFVRAVTLDIISFGVSSPLTRCTPQVIVFQI